MDGENNGSDVGGGENKGQWSESWLWVVSITEVVSIPRGE